VALSKLSSLTDTPDEFICPITQQIFRDPVICSGIESKDKLQNRLNWDVNRYLLFLLSVRIIIVNEWVARAPLNTPPE